MSEETKVEEKPISAAQAEQALQADAAARREVCIKELNELMEKHSCTLMARAVISNLSQPEVTIDVVPLKRK